MPRKQEPKTLIRACLQTITLSFDAICYGPMAVEMMKEIIENDSYRDVTGPFVDWPGTVLYEIMEAISERYTLNKKHLHMLIQPQLQSINLSFGMGDFVNGFPLIQERCKNLKHLNVSYLRHLHPKTLLEVLPCVTNLLSLDLRMTLVSDEVLGLIGKFLKELAYLNLSGTSITDKGIIRLAIAEDGTHLSQKLSRLIISETWVSYGGAALLLVYLPELREFEYEKILEALELVYNWSPALEQSLLNRCGARMKEEPTINPYSLRLDAILSSADYVTDNTIEAAVNLCPNISSFSISNARVMNEHLYKLMALDKLTTLSLTNCESQTIDFETGVLPILSACGENIRNLILTNFTCVSIPDVGRTCPKIQNIAFSKVAIFYLEATCPTWFNYLEAMELWAEPDAEMNPILIKQLVAYCPNIKNLLFNSCDALTDKIFFEIKEENPMKRLSHLTLDHCYHITIATLNAILDSENDLSVLRTWSCPHITKDNRTEIELRLVQENMDVYFDWYEYFP